MTRVPNSEFVVLMNCSRCGETVRDGLRFCTACGAPLHGAEEHAHVNQPKGQGIALPISQWQK